jgi:hypothetical protein
MNIFLDTEFTDFADCDLISIGLVDENGREFYAELTDYRQEACSDFVKQVVIPLLNKQPNTVFGGKYHVAVQLNEWLKHYDDGDQIANICFDYNGDWFWFTGLIQMIPEEELVTNLTATNIWGNLDPMKLDWFWKEMDATKGWQQHQALWDAHGNKFAYRGSFDPTKNV